MKSFWFDMDGVIAKYDVSAYRGDNPLFLQVGKHYYRGVKPDEKAIELLRRLNELKDSRVYVLSKVSTNYDNRWEQSNDKREWLSIHCPFIGDKQIYTTIHNKSELAQAVVIKDLGRVFCSEDILIDDFNDNLLEWQSSGGTSIKYINSYNNPNSFLGKNIFLGGSVDSVIEKLIL